MEADSTTVFDRESFNTELDHVMKSVMPDSWMGHARLACEGLHVRQKATVLKHTRNIVEDRGLPADKTAEKVINKLGY